MTPARSRELVVLSMLGTGAVITLSGFAQGKAPEPRRYLALGLVYVGLSGLAAVSPQLGGTFAGLVLAGAVVNAASGERAADALAKAASKSGPITPADAKPVAASAAAGGSAPVAVGSSIGATSPPLGAPTTGTQRTGGGVVFPAAVRGAIIGRPNVPGSTHAPGQNWESANAVDIAMPVGTPIFATEPGVIGSQIGSLGSGGRFAGLRLHLNGTSGREWYYAHLSRLSVRAGQRVTAGQLLGLSGSANGVAHLHLAVSPPNDPSRILGV